MPAGRKWLRRRPPGKTVSPGSCRLLTSRKAARAALPARFWTKKKAHAFQHELFFIACIFQNTSFRTMVCSLEGPTLTMPIGTPMSFAICSR